MEDIYVGYQQDIMVLNGVSISCSDDFITGLIGPNGAGKSTLLKTLCGFLKPKNGSIYFEGEEVTGNDPHKMSQAGLIYLPQERGIFPSLTVKENLKLGTWIFRNDSEKVEKSMGRVQERFPILKEREDKQANMLSGGGAENVRVRQSPNVKPKIFISR